jgi:hypothetical protein
VKLIIANDDGTVVRTIEDVTASDLRRAPFIRMIEEAVGGAKHMRSVSKPQGARKIVRPEDES